MVLFLNEDDVGQVATLAMALEAVEEVFRGLGQGAVQSRPRQRVRLPNGILHTLVGGVPSSGVAGLKTYAAYPNGTSFLLLLFDSDEGDLLAIMEADRLGQLRTGAASGIATRYLATDDAAIVGLIGTGWQSRTQLEAVCAVRPIRQVRACSRDPGRRAAYCREMEVRLGIEIVPVESAQAAVRGAHVLITITNAREPVLLGEWLQPGQHINAAGANWPDKRELDLEAVRRADLVAADSVEQAQGEAGDVIAAVAAGLLGWEQVVDLGDIVSARRQGRTSPEQITLFESQGLGVQDLAMAARIYRAARQRGLGTELEMRGRRRTDVPR